MNIVDVNSWNLILDKMIVIGGSARSGTTIIGKLINSLDKVEYMFEPPLLNSLLLKSNELSVKSIKELIQFYFFDDFLLNSLAGRNMNLNKNDDSCILHVKDQKEVEGRHSRSFTREELETIVKNTRFSFKLPEIVFFLDLMDYIFPSNKKILMHRDPNGVISSICKKGWFSDESLSENHPAQVHARDIVRGTKVPFWVDDIDFWVGVSEIERCGYYYLKISENMMLSENGILVDYESFVANPNQVFASISSFLEIEYGAKTLSLLDTVSKRSEQSCSFVEQLSSNMKKKVINLSESLKEASI